MDINYLSSTGLVTNLSLAIVESGNDYIRFRNGIQMCFGAVTSNELIDQVKILKKDEFYDLKNVITYPKPFVINDYIAPFTIWCECSV